MKIIQVQTQAEAAGAQRISDMIGEGLRQRGHQVRTVFMYRKTDVYDQDPNADFILKQAPRGLLDQLHAVMGLFAYLTRERPDAVVSFQHYGNLFGTIGGRLAGATHLIANQSGAPHRGGMRGIATRLDRLLGSWHLYDHNVVNSVWTEAQFANYPAAYRARLRRIDHGVPMPADRYERQRARATFGLPALAPLVISTGRLNRLKNHALLVQALAQLPDVHLAIAGAGPEEGAIRRLAGELGVADRLHLVGEVEPERIFEFLATGDVFAFASLTETFGMSAAEAAVAGVPVVATDLAVLREVLEEPSGTPAALFFPPDDGVALAEAIGRVLADAVLANRLATAGKSLSDKYAPARMCLAYEALLSD
jgi:glycosyltransferase involved in cell wall biosynthesis